MIRLSLFISMLALLAVALLALSTRDPAVVAANEPPKKEDKDPMGFGGRTGADKARLLKEFGGSEKSEEAVMLGLAWLTQMQKKDGSWVFTRQDAPAATGLALLSFLGAGQSHQVGRYQQTVKAGLDWLLNNITTAGGEMMVGKFKGLGTGEMYGHGIATLALCEAYGLTHDKAILPAAQSAIDYIQRAQAADGGWRYTFRAPGDTSVVGWQVQALHAAMLTQDIKVDPAVIRKAIAFLDRVSSGPYKSMYGYIGGGGGQATNVTAIGLLLRYYIDNWRTETRGFAEGVKGLMTRAPSRQRRQAFDMYYYYYATQVVRFYGQEEWATWNEGPKAGDGTRSGGIQDWLISLQDRGTTDRGSWPPDSTYMGHSTGRLGTTALCLLTLEVYYRYSPEEANANNPK